MVPVAEFYHSTFNQCEGASSNIAGNTDNFASMVVDPRISYEWKWKAQSLAKNTRLKELFVPICN